MAELPRTDPTAMRHSVIAAVRRLVRWMAALPDWTYLTLARFAIALVVWQSGREKAEGVTVKTDTLYTFEFDYQLPLINPYVAAYLWTIAEHILPILLVIGLGSRFVAAILLLMTLIAQVYIAPSDVAAHGLATVVLLVIIARGSGPLSLDRLIARRFM